MANKINLTLKVNDDGTLDITAKKAKKAADETEKLGKATDKAAKARSRYNKGEKGVAQAGMNSTKAFSKMRSEMGGGSSGLVGAYATLAANVFAATAAFGALQRAAEFEQLTASVEFFGNQAGRNLELIVDQLVEVTDGALSAEQAFRGTALAVSSGFDTEQLVRLTGVAKGASVALGRDLNDAFDRLVRGAAKLEPEILDELGIMVRLDDAVRDYATELGKVPSQLTAFEKRQAFLNATIKAGESQFQELSENVPVNPFNQLAAAFSNLTKEGIGLLNTVLVPVANFFAGSQTALIGGTVLFASTISRQMLPALADSAGALARVSEASRDNSLANLGMLEAVSKNDTKYNRFLAGLADGTKTLDDAEEAFESLDRSHAFHNARLGEGTAAQALNDAQRKAATAGKAAAQVEINRLTAAINANSLATAQNTAANAASAAGSFKFITAFSLLGSSVKRYSADLKANESMSKNAKTSFKGLRVAAFATGAGIRVLTSSLFALLGPIGLLISFGPALLDFFRNKFFPASEVDEKFERILAMTDKVKDADEQFTQSSVTGSARRVAGAKAALGAQLEIITMLDQTLALERENAKEAEETSKAALAAANAQKTALEERIAAMEAAGPGRNARAFNKSLRDARAELAATNQSITDLDNKIKRSAEIAEKGGPRFGEAVEKGLQALKDSPALSEFMSPAIKEVEGLVQKFNAGEISAETLGKRFKEISDEADAGTQFINGIQGAVQGLATQQNALKSKAQGPYDAITNAAKGVVAELDKVTKGATSIADALKSDTLSKYKDQIDAIFGKDTTEGEIRAFTDQLIKNNNTVKQFPGLLEESKQRLQILNQVANLSPAAFAAANEELDNQRELRKDALAAERDLVVAAETKNGVLSEEGKILQDNFNRKIRAVEVEAQLDTVEARRIKSSEIALKNEKMFLGVRQKIISATKQQLDAQRQIREAELSIQNLQDPTKRTAQLDPAQILNERKKEFKEREQLIADEFDARVKIVEIEGKLTKLKFQLIREQLRAAGELDSQTDNLITDAISNVDTLVAKQGQVAADQATAAQRNLEKQLKTAEVAFVKQAQSQATSLQGLFNLSTTNIGEGDDAVGGFDFFMDNSTMQEKVNFAKGLTQEYVETLKTLGPEGEFMASITQGAFAVTDAFVALGDNLDKTTDKNKRFGAVAAAVGASIGAINQMMQAGYQKTIASIDQQIEAEQKRDGKSAASVARIQALEKKKEQQQRKAFEMNKKMLIAQTIMNTAAAVMATMRDTGFFGSPLAMIVAAMGAAQVAMIASQSFQGGGSSAGSSGMPTSISAGERRNTVDISRSRSARGELAYLRGEAGTGGPENFTPAFAGYRNRAEGGNTGFMVGEQGPELFVPDRPGRIVPNDDIAAGAPTNVTFNINAIDAVGVEEVISTQRGNIIGMIRSAANSYGQDFIESVDTTVFDDNTVRSQAGSVSRY